MAGPNQGGQGMQQMRHDGPPGGMNWNGPRLPMQA